MPLPPQQPPQHPLRRLPLVWRQRLEAGHMAGEAHNTLAHAETRRNLAMATTLRIIVKAAPSVSCAAPWRGVSFWAYGWFDWDAPQ
jgi:hypothetical protein